MRAISLIPVLMLLVLPATAHSDQPNMSPSAAAENNEARWADWDAQSRVTEGDYDGAVQAEQQASAARKAADELAARARTNPNVRSP